MTVLSFEKPVRSPEEDNEDREQMESYLTRRQIKWIRLRYHKSPSLLATLYDIVLGVRRIVLEHSRQKIDLVHARGYVPGAIAWGVKRWIHLPYLFDIRGLQAEEYVDAGNWNDREIRFRLTKQIEQRILRDVDGIVTLTEAVRPILRHFPGLRSRPTLPPWEVIPCCVDLDHFCFREDGRIRVRAELGVADRPILVYAGSIGTWYLLDKMLEFFATARKTCPDLYFLILANDPGEKAVKALRSQGISDRDATALWARYEELPDYLSAADVGVAFIRPCLSKRSSSPSKFAEYLACGLPIVINAGIGDADALIEKGEAGILIRAFNEDAYRIASMELPFQMQRDRRVFRNIAEKQFSLSERAYPTYRQLYNRILTVGDTKRQYP